MVSRNIIISSRSSGGGSSSSCSSRNINTIKYHVFAPMGRFQLERQKQPTVRWKDGGK